MASIWEEYIRTRVAQSIKNVRFFAEIYNYEVIQINGQRVFGPPKVWTDPPPGKGCEIYVSNLPRDVFEDELIPVFWKAGVIYQLRLMMEYAGTNRGFCFIQYCDKSAAQRAVKMFRDLCIRSSCKLFVARSTDNCRLFVGGIPRDATQQELEEKLHEVWDLVKEVTLYPSHLDKNLNRGFAFVEFENHRAAAIARRNSYPHKLKFCEVYLKVDWAIAENMDDVDDPIFEKVKTLYVRNLPAEVNEKELKIAFLQNSPGLYIERLKIVKDFAFVHFACREDAEVAFHLWDKMNLKGRIIQVKWAKPPPEKAEHSCLLSNSGFVQCKSICRSQPETEIVFPNQRGQLQVPIGYACVAPLSHLQPSWVNMTGRSTNHFLKTNKHPYANMQHSP